MKLIIITGLSGSGKSTALQMLEDLDFYCIDNLPVGLLQAFATRMLDTMQREPNNAAIGIDARNLEQDLQHFPEVLDELKGSGLACEIFFLDAEDKVLLKRFSETRRKHPLTGIGLSLAEAIAHERKLLDPMLSSAALHIDTSHMNIHQLRATVKERVEDTSSTAMSLLFQSFGYKNGIPAGADFVFDLRCLPNPHWEPALRPLSGLTPEVGDFLARQPAAERMYHDIKNFLENWIPCFKEDRRSYMTVALGCTGGQHRSVYFAKLLWDHFRQHHSHVMVRHRELG